MSTSFLIIYFMAIISILIGIGGLIMLIFGLINKKKNLTINGSILSFIAIVLFVTGVFWGARRVSGILWNSVNKEIKILECKKTNSDKIIIKILAEDKNLLADILNSNQNKILNR